MSHFTYAIKNKLNNNPFESLINLLHTTDKINLQTCFYLSLDRNKTTYISIGEVYLFYCHLVRIRWHFQKPEQILYFRFNRDFGDLNLSRKEYTKLNIALQLMFFDPFLAFIEPFKLKNQNVWNLTRAL